MTTTVSRLLDGRLEVDVNSAERAAEIERIVSGALPDAELVDQGEREIAPPDDDDAGAAALPATDDPEVRSVLAGYIAEMERQWLDESIPALGGRTPRDAARDPIGRFELTRLLASFPEPDPDDVGMMSPNRLRTALGLSVSGD